MTLDWAACQFRHCKASHWNTATQYKQEGMGPPPGEKGRRERYLVSTAAWRGIGDVRLHPGILLDVIKEEVVVQEGLGGDRKQEPFSHLPSLHSSWRSSVYKHRPRPSSCKCEPGMWLPCVIIEKARRGCSEPVPCSHSKLTFFPLKNSPPNRISSSFSGWADSDAFNLGVEGGRCATELQFNA